MSEHTIHVDARRWFERTNGNTYHSVSVIVDGKHVGVVPFAYGYDRHFLVTAGKVVKEFAPEVGLEDAYDLASWSWRDAHGISLTEDVVDVPRKRDLHSSGRA